MARKKKPLPILENVTITDCAAEGKALARVNDMVVFVPFCVPGDVVDLQVRKKRRSYCEAEVIRFIKKSEVREEPFCQHFGICGGCKWQTLPYEKQLEMKQQQVFQQLTRIGKIALPEFSPILGSVKTREYRNKLEFGCSSKRWMTREEIATGEPAGEMRAIGFHITGAFDKILPIEKCHLMDNLQNEIRNSIRDFAISSGMTFFDLRQTNTDQAYHLYSVARDFARLSGDEVVYDLYTGTGTIANFVAKKAKKVVGIEYVPEAIEDAKVNSEINGICNTLFYAGDMKDILNDEFIAQHGRPDVIITDPPRAGMHQDVVDTILRAEPKRIVYVSCNPATQARDLQLLDAKYKVTAVQPVDMFPHTPHVENVVARELK